MTAANMTLRQQVWQTGYNDGRAGKSKRNKGSYKSAYKAGWQQGNSDRELANRSVMLPNWSNLKHQEQRAGL